MTDNFNGFNFSTLVGLLRYRAIHQPDQKAFTFLRDGETESGSLSYQELDRQARAIAVSLQFLGATGERALLLYPSGLEFIAAFFGCLYAGVIAVPAYPPRKKQEKLSRLKAIAENAQAKVALTTQFLLPNIKGQLAQNSEMADLQLVGTDNIAIDLTSNWQEPEITNDTLAFLQYTSGSTGTPKGVMVSHGNILHNQQMIKMGFQHTEKTIFVGWLPLFHDMGLIGNMLQPLYLGIPCILMPPEAFLQEPVRWLQAISRYRATTSGGPNFAYELCIQKITSEQRKNLDLRSWEVAFSGAEPVRAETLERFATTFESCGFRAQSFYPCYGMAETTLFVSGGLKTALPVVCQVDGAALEQNRVVVVEKEQKNVRKIVGCGQTWLNQKIMIVNPESLTQCPAEQVGEIWVSGANVARGYWYNSEQTKQTFQAYLADTGEGPFLRTGDLGFLKDGELFITGRLKDIMIIRGRNHYPQDIEITVQKSHPALRPDCGAAFAVDIEGESRLVVAQEVERSYLRKLNVDEVVGAIRSSVSEQHDLQVYAVLLLKTATIPKTSSGKIQRHACQKRFIEGSLELVGSWEANNFATNQEHLPIVQPLSALKQQTLSLSRTTNHTKESNNSKKRADDLINWLHHYANQRINSQLIDERRCIPPYIVLDFGKQGLLGMQIPETYSGLALNHRDTLRVVEQLAAIDLTLATFVGGNNILGIHPIQHFATETLRDELLPSLAKGSEIAALAITEPGAGSNPRAISSQAVANGKNSWKLYGTKVWSGSASWASIINVFVQQLDANNKPIGITGFAVHQGRKGLRLGPEALTMGMRGMVQNTLYLEGIQVSTDALLGQPGAGMNVANETFMLARLGIGAMSLGAMKRCAQLMHRYATYRSISTGRLLDNPLTLIHLSDLSAGITALETLVALVAELLDQGVPVPHEMFIACKTSGPEFLWQAADTLVQILGGRGYLENNIAPQILRDARLFRIFEGPTETLNMHLGSIVIHSSEELSQFLRNRLQVPEVADKLRDAAQQIYTRCLEADAPFSARSSALRWAQIRSGEVATYAILLAAVQRAFNQASSTTMQRALLWSQRHFEQALAKALRGSPGESVLLNADETADLISSYAETIGDLEQTLAGEDRVLDPFLSQIVTVNHLDKSYQSTPVSLENQADERNLKTFVHSVESIENWLTNWIEQKLGIAKESIDRTKPLSFYGLDSVTTMSLTSGLENLLGLELPSNLAWDYPTISDIVEYLVKEVSSPALSPKEDVVDSPAKPVEEAKTDFDKPFNGSGTSPNIYSPKESKFLTQPVDRQPFNGSGFPPTIHSPKDPKFLKGRVERFYRRMEKGNPVKGKIPGSADIKLLTNDYLSLAAHPAILQAQAEVLLENGNGLMMSGVYQPAQSPQRNFEQQMAALIQTEDVVVCQSGYCANVGLIQSIVDESTPVYIDLFAHASLWEGARSAGVTVRPFKHNDMAHLEKLLQKHGSGVIAVDSMYSINGNICPLKEITLTAQKYECVLVVDESHSLGVYGASGEGLVAKLGLASKVHFRTASLSKAFCGRGGIVAGSAQNLEYFRYESRPAIFSSVVLSHEIAAFEKTLEIIQQDHWRREKLMSNAYYLRNHLSQIGYNVESSQSPIIALESGTEARTIILREALESRGIFGAVFCAPATPLDGALVRFSVNCGLNLEQLDRVIEVCAKIRDEVNLEEWESVRRKQGRRAMVL